MGETVIIREIRKEEWEDAMALVWRTFLKYEACDYEEEGVRNFLDFITDERLKKLHEIGEYPVLAAFAAGGNEDLPDHKKAVAGEKRTANVQHMVGVVSMRSINHVSLLFVDGAYHKRGIGTKLLYSLVELVLADGRRKSLTVNAAPYATEFYHKTGFCDTDKMQKKEGISYTPMEWIFTSFTGNPTD